MVTASRFPSPLKSPMAAGKIPKIAPPATVRGGLKNPIFVGGAVGRFALFLRGVAFAGEPLGRREPAWSSDTKLMREARTARTTTRRRKNRLVIGFIGTPFKTVLRAPFWDNASQPREGCQNLIEFFS